MAEKDTMKTALVLGSNAGQADLARYLSEEGWRVAVCAHRAGGKAEAYADMVRLVDITDLNGVEALAREIDADLVYSVSTDVAVPTVVEVSRRIGLPHYFDSDLVALLDDKAALREYLNARNLSVVPFRRLKSAEDAAGWSAYPCIVKPADSQGQRGVQKVLDDSSLKAAIETAIALSPTQTAIIEAWLSGVEISANVLISNGQVVVNEISERLVHGDHLLGVPRGHLVPPVDVSAENCAAARQLVEDVAASFGQVAGTLYFQMKVTDDGPRIIEIAPRLDGCHMWRCIKHATGIDYLDLAVRQLMGADIGEHLQRREPEGVYELMFQQVPAGGIFRSADFAIPADALYHEYRYSDGDEVLPINGKLEVVGYYVRRRTE